MKKLLPLLVCASILAALASSCGINRYMVTPSVSLSTNNFTYVGDVEATETDVLVFGIGGLKTFDPMKLLREKYPLGPGEAYANISVSQNNRFFIVVAHRTFIVSAQIVRFSDTPVATEVQQQVSGDNAPQTTPQVNRVVVPSQEKKPQIVNNIKIEAAKEMVNQLYRDCFSTAKMKKNGAEYYTDRMKQIQDSFAAANQQVSGSDWDYIVKRVESVFGIKIQ